MREPIYSYSLNLQRKKKEKKWNCRWEKMSKAIEENELAVTIKSLYWEFNLY